MLQPAKSYDDLKEGFTWDIPAHYNMGVDTCDKWANRDPERTALIDLTGPARQDVSFATLKRLSNQLANYLKGLDVQPGDRVAVFRSQSVWTAAAHIAIWKLGAISMPLFTLFRTEALLSRLQNSEACAVIGDEHSIHYIMPLQPGLPELNHVVCPETIPFENTSTEYTPFQTRATDPALLIYTSGTTGAPKGALLPHQVLLGHLPGVELSHDFLPQHGDCLWTPADWAWIGGLLDVLMPGLHHGVPVVAARLQKFNAKECIDIIRQGSVRNIFFPPTALKILREDKTHITGLRSIASGGEPLGGELLEWGKSAFGLTINEFYGQTECNMIVSSCGALFSPQEGCTGHPVPGHTVAVIDETGQPTHTEGDIAVRRGTPVMMLKYWRNPEATRQKFRGDWLITGDRGIMNNGFIRFIGRTDDVITSAGYRIGPSAIENCLLSHPDIVGAAVVGKPDSKRTEIVKAYVKLREGISGTPALMQELQTHVANKLSAHEYPREIEFVPDFPMTVTGKIIRKDLKARAISEAEAL